MPARCRKLAKMIVANQPLSKASPEQWVKIIEHIKLCSICQKDMWVRSLRPQTGPDMSFGNRDKVVDHFLAKKFSPSKFKKLDQLLIQLGIELPPKSLSVKDRIKYYEDKLKQFKEENLDK